LGLENTLKGTKLTQFLHFLNAALVLVLAWLVLVTANPLPELVPLQFDSDGTPTRFGSKSGLAVLLIVVVIVDGIFYLAMLAIPWLRKRPKSFSFPDKEKFLELPETKQQIYWDMLKEFLAAFAASLNITFVTAIWGTIQVASGNLKKLPGWAILPGLIIILLVNVIYIRRMMRMPKELIESKA
jgi:uncharacterized membrane protein